MPGAVIRMAARRQIASSGRARSGSIRTRDRTDKTPGTAEWVSHTNVDSGRYAVALEQLLTDALVTMPRLIYETIRAC
jgi:hypothetical protein